MPPSQGSREDIRPADHEERMRAVERFTGWHLGSRQWGALIVGVYLNPDEAMKNLDAEIGDL